MGLLNFWKKDREPEFTKAASTYVSMMLDGIVRGGGIAHNYKSMAENGYMANGAVFNSTRTIAQCAGAVPWALFTGSGDDRQRVVGTHPLTDLWARPNRRMGNARFIEYIISYMQIAGEAFITTVDADGGLAQSVFDRSSTNGPSELIFLRPDTVSFTDANNELSDIIWTSPSSKKLKIDREEVLHLKWFHPTDETRGLSPIQVGSLSIEQSNLAKRWNKSLMKKAGRPSSILKSKVPPPEDVRNKILERFREEIGGADNAGDAIFLTGDLDWERASLTPEETSWIEGQKLSNRDISITEGVPPQLNGDTESSTYANYGEARKALYLERVIPVLLYIRDEVNVWLTPRFGEGIMLDIVKKEIEALQEERADEWNRLKQADWLTINEKRSAIGLEANDDERSNTPVVLLPRAGTVTPEAAALERERELGMSLPVTNKFKAFNLIDVEEIQLHWKQIEAARRSLMPAVRARIGKSFRDEAQLVIGELYRTESPQQVIDTIPTLLSTTQKDLAKSLEVAFVVVAVKFGRTVIGKLPTQRIPKEFVLAEVEQDARLYLSEVANQKIANIHATTARRVSEAVREQMESGAPLDEIAKTINREFSDRERLKMIAETETTAASNLGAQRGAAHSGFESKKRWITELDSSVREIHGDAHGQEKKMEEPYEVGGESLRFPGDSASASARNVINCRCTESYVIVN